MVSFIKERLVRLYRRIKARFREAFLIGMQSLLANKLRSFLTLFGVVIGVMTVVGMMSIIEGLNDSMAKQIGELGTNVIYIQKYPAVHFGPPDPKIRQRKDLTIEDAKAIDELCPSVLNAAPEMSRYADVKYGSQKIDDLEIYGGDWTTFDIESLNIDIGRAITEEDVLTSSYVCIIGSKPKESLFPIEDPIGKYIRIKGVAFKVIGVTEKKGEFLGESMDNYIFIPYTAFTKIFGREHTHLSISVQAVSKEKIGDAISEVESVLRKRRGVPPEMDNDFEIITQDSLMELYNKITGSAFAVMIGVAGISLLVGGIGIMNIMLISVAERTREIGIRKAVGAKKNDILLQFLLESATISIVGGVIGIIVGISIAFLIAGFSTLNAAIPVWSVIMGFTFSLGVGLFFGLYPAYKASILDPIKALRYE
ncbi:MAG: ABC transporter permease [bacterium]